MKKPSISFLLLLASLVSWSQSGIISFTPAKGSFPISTNNVQASILVSETDHTLVHKAAELFSQDIEAITGKKPMLERQPGGSKYLIIIGSIQQSTFIKQLVKDKKLDVSSIR